MVRYFKFHFQLRAPLSHHKTDLTIDLATPHYPDNSLLQIGSANRKLKTYSFAIYLQQAFNKLAGLLRKFATCNVVNNENFAQR